MRTELICVGTELLVGKLNTNSVYIGEKLASVGLDLALETTVGDNEEALEKVFAAALARGGLVIVTGGLGPTFDDLTREMVARVLGRRLVLQQDALEAIRERFARRGITMTENNERQAYLIDGGTLLPNPNGTAPGQRVEVREGARLQSVIILLPGPPKEMQAMFESQVFPYIKKYEIGVKKSFVLHVAGMPESAVDAKIRPIIDTERRLEGGDIDFTILAHPGIIDIKASIRGTDELLVDEALNTMKRKFYDVLGNHIYGEGKATLESVTGELLFKHNRTLSLAESCTGGLVAHRITNVPGSSRYFTQGVVSYANNAKVDRLGVSEKTLTDFGAVSEQTAREMAQGIRATAGTDYAVAITGIAGPAGGTPEKPVGLVFIGVASPGGETVARFQFPGDRTSIRESAANQALDLLRQALLKEEMNEKKKPK